MFVNTKFTKKYLLVALILMMLTIHTVPDISNNYISNNSENNIADRIDEKISDISTSVETIDIIEETNSSIDSLSEDIFDNNIALNTWYEDRETVKVDYLSKNVTVKSKDYAYKTDFEFLLKWGSFGSGNGEFNFQQEIAVDLEGNVYVSDGNNHRMQKFDNTGAYLLQWGSFGSGNGEFDFPYGIAVDSEGDVYVSDQNNHRIQKFDSTGAYLLQWGSTGTGDGEFVYPRGIAVDSEGDVYVSDGNNHRIQKFDSTGAYLLQWGSTGTGDGEFKYPYGIAVDSEGDVYVADQNNHRIQKFDNTGAYLLQWGSTGSGNSEFVYPYGLAVDIEGNVYVSDGNNHRMQKFDSTGAYLLQWGSTGSGNGEFAYPRGIAVDSEGDVYVVDTNNHRIQKFGFTIATIEPIGMLPNVIDNNNLIIDNIKSIDTLSEEVFIGFTYYSMSAPTQLGITFSWETKRSSIYTSLFTDEELILTLDDGSIYSGDELKVYFVFTYNSAGFKAEIIAFDTGLNQYTSNSILSSVSYFDEFDNSIIKIDYVEAKSQEISSQIRSDLKYSSRTQILHSITVDVFDYRIHLSIYTSLAWNFSSITPSASVSWDSTNNYYSITNTIPTTYTLLFNSGEGWGIDYARQKQILTIDDGTSAYLTDPSFESGSNDFTSVNIDSLEVETSIVKTGNFALNWSDWSGGSEQLLIANVIGEFYFSFSYYVVDTVTFSRSQLRVDRAGGSGVYDTFEIDTSITDRWITVFFYINPTETRFSDSTEFSLWLDFYQTTSTFYQILFDGFFIGVANGAAVNIDYSTTRLSATARSWDGLLNPVVPNIPLELSYRNRADNVELLSRTLTTDANGYAYYDYYSETVTLSEKEIRTWSYDSWGTPTYDEFITDASLWLTITDVSTISILDDSIKFEITDYSNDFWIQVYPDNPFSSENMDYFVFNSYANKSTTIDTTQLVSATAGEYDEFTSNYEITTTDTQYIFETTGYVDMDRLQWNIDETDVTIYFHSIRYIQAQKSYFTPTPIITSPLNEFDFSEGTVDDLVAYDGDTTTFMDGMLNITSTEGDYWGYTTATTFTTDYSITTRMQILDTGVDTWAGIVFNDILAEPSAGTSDDYFMIRGGTTQTLFRIGGYETTPIVSSSLNTWMDIRLDVSDEYVSIYIDGTLIATRLNVVFDSTPTIGIMGFSSNVIVDHLLIGYQRNIQIYAHEDQIFASSLTNSLSYQVYSDGLLMGTYDDLDLIPVNISETENTITMKPFLDKLNTTVLLTNDIDLTYTTDVTIPNGDMYIRFQNAIGENMPFETFTTYYRFVGDTAYTGVPYNLIKFNDTALQVELLINDTMGQIILSATYDYILFNIITIHAHEILFDNRLPYTLLVELKQPSLLWATSYDFWIPIENFRTQTLFNGTYDIRVSDSTQILQTTTLDVVDSSILTFSEDVDLVMLSKTYAVNKTSVTLDLWTNYGDSTITVYDDGLLIGVFAEGSPISWNFLGTVNTSYVIINISRNIDKYAGSENQIITTSFTYVVEHDLSSEMYLQFKSPQGDVIPYSTFTTYYRFIGESNFKAVPYGVIPFNNTAMQIELFINDTMGQTVYSETINHVIFKTIEIDAYTTIFNNELPYAIYLELKQDIIGWAADIDIDFWINSNDYAQFIILNGTYDLRISDNVTIKTMSLDVMSNHIEIFSEEPDLILFDYGYAVSATNITVSLWTNYHDVSIAVYDDGTYIDTFIGDSFSWEYMGVSNVSQVELIVSKDIEKFKGTDSQTFTIIFDYQPDLPNEGEMYVRFQNAIGTYLPFESFTTYYRFVGDTTYIPVPYGMIFFNNTELQVELLINDTMGQILVNTIYEYTIFNIISFNVQEILFDNNLPYSLLIELKQTTLGWDTAFSFWVTSNDYRTISLLSGTYDYRISNINGILSTTTLVVSDDAVESFSEEVDLQLMNANYGTNDTSVTINLWTNFGDSVITIYDDGSLIGVFDEGDLISWDFPINTNTSQVDIYISRDINKYDGIDNQIILTSFTYSIDPISGSMYIRFQNAIGENIPFESFTTYYRFVGEPNYTPVPYGMVFFNNTELQVELLINDTMGQILVNTIYEYTIFNILSFDVYELLFDNNLPYSLLIELKQTILGWDTAFSFWVTSNDYRSISILSGTYDYRISNINGVLNTTSLVVSDGVVLTFSEEVDLLIQVASYDVTADNVTVTLLTNYGDSTISIYDNGVLIGIFNESDLITWAFPANTNISQVDVYVSRNVTKYDGVVNQTIHTSFVYSVPRTSGEMYLRFQNAIGENIPFESFTTYYRFVGNVNYAPVPYGMILFNDTRLQVELMINDTLGQILINSIYDYVVFKTLSFNVFEILFNNQLDYPLLIDLKQPLLGWDTSYSFWVSSNNYRTLTLLLGTYDMNVSSEIELLQSILLVVIESSVIDLKEDPDLYLFGYTYEVDLNNVTVNYRTNYGDSLIYIWDDVLGGFTYEGVFEEGSDITWYFDDTLLKSQVYMEIAYNVSKFGGIDTQIIPAYFTYIIDPATIDDSFFSSIGHFEYSTYINVTISSNQVNATVTLHHDNILIHSGLNRTFMLLKNLNAGNHNITVKVNWVDSNGTSYSDWYSVAYWVAAYYTAAIEVMPMAAGLKVLENQIDITSFNVYVEGVFVFPSAEDPFGEMDTTAINRSIITDGLLWLRNTVRNLTIDIKDKWDYPIWTGIIDIGAFDYRVLELPLAKLTLQNLDDDADYSFSLYWYNATSELYVVGAELMVAANSISESIWITSNLYLMDVFDVDTHEVIKYGQEVQTTFSTKNKELSGYEVFIPQTENVGRISRTYGMQMSSQGILDAEAAAEPTGDYLEQISTYISENILAVSIFSIIIILGGILISTWVARRKSEKETEIDIIPEVEEDPKRELKNVEVETSNVEPIITPSNGVNKYEVEKTNSAVIVSYGRKNRSKRSKKPKRSGPSWSKYGNSSRS